MTTAFDGIDTHDHVLRERVAKALAERIEAEEKAESEGLAVANAARYHRVLTRKPKATQSWQKSHQSKGHAGPGKYFRACR